MGYIYVYTGTGGGKTTNALGLALRSIGHKHKVVIIQFLKWWKKTGEYKIKERLKPYYEIYQFGRKGWIGLDNLGEEDRILAKKGLDFAWMILDKQPHLLVLDEANLAAHCKVLGIDELLEFIDKAKKTKTDIVLTGRYAPQKLQDAADFVIELSEKKMPKEFETKKGIQY